MSDSLRTESSVAHAADCFWLQDRTPFDSPEWASCSCGAFEAVAPSGKRTILVCGSRVWRDRGAVRLVLTCEPRNRGWGSDRIKVIHGAASGADAFAGQAAQELGYEVEAFPAKWETEGRKAGPLRNLRMLDEKPDLVVAFGHGRGTDHTVREAEKRGVPVVGIGREHVLNEALRCVDCDASAEILFRHRKEDARA